MELFTAEQKLFDLIRMNHHLLAVLERFGIRLGFGDLTISEACSKYQIHLPLFLGIVNEYQHQGYSGKMPPDGFPVDQLVTYLRRTHQQYTGFIIPELEHQLDQLFSSSERKQEIEIIRRFYLGCRQELINHMQFEEEHVFPYISELLEYAGMLEKGLPVKKNFVLKSMLDFEATHESIDEKINDLKNIIIRHITPDYNPHLGTAFLNNLFEFEHDLANHSRIEDYMLIPGVMKIEEKIRKYHG